MARKQLITVPVDKVKPYENNPRLNDDAVDAVKKSIEQCEYIAPIICDEQMIIMGGHTRLKALKELGAKECEVLVVEGLSDEQKRKYRLLDNKTGELALWDFDKLAEELEGLDFGDLELDWGLSNFDYLSELLEDGLNNADGAEPQNFSVTFTFDKSLKDRWDNFVGAYGKDAMQAVIEKAMEGGSQ